MRGWLAGAALALSIGSAQAQLSNPNVVQLNSSFTAGDLLAGGGSNGGVVDTSTLSSATLPTGLSITGNKVYAGASAPGNSWLFINGATLSGTASQAGDGVISPFHIYIGADTVDTTTSGGGNLIGLSVLHALSAGSTGGRTAIQGSLAIVGTPTTLSASGYVGVLGITRVSSTLGGATGVYTNYKGAAFGGTSNVFTNSTSTFLTGIYAHEFDVTLDSTSSAAEKHALNIALGSLDATRAVYDDNAVVFAAQDNASAVGWKTGIMFGAYAHQWAFATDSTLIGAQIRQVGAASSSVALNGVDFSSVTFQSGGCAFKSTGFCVNPSGVPQLSGVATGTPTASLCLDVSNNVVKKTTTGSCV